MEKRRMAKGAGDAGGVNDETGNSGADNLLSELTSLRKKLEKLMEHDFKAQEEAKLRKEIVSARLARTKKHNLEDASRLREEAMKLCERWKQHRASDPTGLRPAASSSSDLDTVQSDPDIPRLQPIQDAQNEEAKKADYKVEHLREANQIMADVHAKYENEEKWLRQRMEQLQKEAEEIENFKVRLERGRVMWESCFHQQEESTDQEMSKSCYATFDDQHVPLDQPSIPQEENIPSVGNPDQEQCSTPPFMDPPICGYAPWTSIFQSVQRNASATFTSKIDDGSTEMVRNISEGSQMISRTVTTCPFENEPIENTGVNFALHPAMRPVDQMPLLEEQKEDSPMRISILADQKERADVEVVLNVSLAAAEVDFFCDCTLREKIVPILRAEASSALRSSKMIEIGNEFVWTLTTSRQSSDRGTPRSSSSNSRRSSEASVLPSWKLAKPNRRSRSVDQEKMEDIMEDEGRKMEGGDGERTVQADELYRAVERLRNELMQRLPGYKTEKGNGGDGKSLDRESHGAHKEPERNTGEVRRWVGLTVPKLGLPRQEKVESVSRSAGTSLETVATVASSTSSNGQSGKRTLAETVQATQQLRKQLSDIISTYDREVTYLLLSVDNYRQQWKREHGDTQKQLSQLTKNVKRLERHAERKNSESSSTQENRHRDKRRRNKTDPFGDQPKLKHYNPELELAVGKEKLYELNRQLIELYMQLNNENSSEYDKYNARKMVTKILKQLLDIRSDPEDKSCTVDPSTPVSQSTTVFQDSAIVSPVPLALTPSNISAEVPISELCTKPRELVNAQCPKPVQPLGDLFAQQNTKAVQAPLDSHPKSTKPVQIAVDRHPKPKPVQIAVDSHPKSSKPVQIPIINVTAPKQEVQSVSVDCELHKDQPDDKSSSVLAYVVPHRGRRSFSADNAVQEPVGTANANTNKTEWTVVPENVQSDNGTFKPFKLKSDRNIISVTCERKRSRSIETSFHRTAFKVSDRLSIHEWAPQDLPRYVSDGETPSTLRSHTLPKEIENSEHKVELACRHREEPEKKADWPGSPVYESSVDSGIGLPIDAEGNAKKVAKQGVPEMVKVAEECQSEAPMEDEVRTCHIHLHRYDLSGPAEFCRRSRIEKRSASMPDAFGKQKSQSPSTVKCRRPSPVRFRKPIEKTEVGDAVLAMGVQLVAVVMSPSKRWTDVARAFLHTNFTDKFKRAKEYYKKMHCRTRSASVIPGRLDDKTALILAVPPQYGRRTVSERQLQGVLIPNLAADYSNETGGSTMSEILRNPAFGDSTPQGQQQTHRTNSQVDVFGAKKKNGLRWKDNAWDEL